MTVVTKCGGVDVVGGVCVKKSIISRLFSVDNLRYHNPKCGLTMTLGDGNVAGNPPCDQAHGLAVSGGLAIKP